MTLFLIPLPDQTQLDTLRKGSEEDGFQWKSILTTLKIQDYDSKSPKQVQRCKWRIQLVRFNSSCYMKRSDE